MFLAVWASPNTNDLAPVSLLGSCLASVHSGAFLQCVFLFGSFWCLLGLRIKMDQGPYQADLHLDINRIPPGLCVLSGAVLVRISLTHSQ